MYAYFKPFFSLFPTIFPIFSAFSQIHTVRFFTLFLVKIPLFSQKKTPLKGTHCKYSHILFYSFS